MVDKVNEAPLWQARADLEEAWARKHEAVAGLQAEVLRHKDRANRLEIENARLRQQLASLQGGEHGGEPTSDQLRMQFPPRR